MKRWHELKRSTGDGFRSSKPGPAGRAPLPPYRRSLPAASKVAGFSMIELLVVVAIILILTTLYWGGSSGRQKRGKRAACQQNLEKIFMAMQIYATDFTGRYPAVTNATNSADPLDLLVPRYTVDASFFICPGSRDAALPEGEPIRGRQVSYAYYMGRTATSPDVLMTDRQVDTLGKTPGQAVFSSTGKPPGNNHSNGGNYLFCDGHMVDGPAQAIFSLDVTNGIVLLNP